jgi:hypothetical protein
MDDKLSTDDFETGKNENKSDESYYVEKRYCTVCNLEQPIRSKHCKECKRCVAMYDHHVRRKKIIFLGGGLHTDIKWLNPFFLIVPVDR